MEMQFSVFQIRRRVFVTAELHTSAQQTFAGRQPIQPNIGAVYDCRDEPLVGRIVDFASEGRNQGIPDPVEHAPIGQHRVFRVCIRRIGSRPVAPQLPAADKIQRRNNALAI